MFGVRGEEKTNTAIDWGLYEEKCGVDAVDRHQRRMAVVSARVEMSVFLLFLSHIFSRLSDSKLITQS